MIFKNALLLLLTAIALTLSSCSSTSVSLEYQPSLGQNIPGPRKVAVGRFADLRREGGRALGAVKTPVGTPMEYITTNVPVDQVVRNAFAHGLSSRRMLVSEAGAPFMLTGEVLQLYTDQVIRPAAYATIRVNLVRTNSGRIVFSRVYRAEQEGKAYLPGSGSPVPMLRELASRALQHTVDSALDDAGFRVRLTHQP